MENSELFNLLDLQKSLTYFTTSLRSNYIVTEKLLRLRSTNQSGHLIKLYEEDEDLLEDVIIEYKQAIEMVEMYSHILNSMMEVFASIISNCLLYTSDAADDLLCVDLGGRRIIKKKKKKQKNEKK